MLDNANNPIKECDIRFDGRSFYLPSEQVIYYDPDATSEFSLYMETHLQEIKDWFRDQEYEFCYIPDICKHITDEEIRYLIPNWNGEPVNELGNNLLKEWLSDEHRNIGAGFIRKNRESGFLYKFFPLASIKQQPLIEQLEQYKTFLNDRLTEYDQIRFSVTESREDEGLYSVFEKKFCLADENFSERDIDIEIRKIVERLHKEGVEEFVLRCMVPVEEKLSRIVITSKFEIILPDYGNKLIEISPLPKAVFLLFLRHEEGIFFKELMDYREELQSIYSKISNRTSSAVVDSSLEAITDPTKNSINEKCSRIREAFVSQMDERLAEKYTVTGWRGQRKRITLPRNLVEWQCEL